MAPLVESVTEKMRVINDLTFQPETPRRTQGGVNRDKVTGDIPRRPCGEVFLCLLKEIVRLQVNTSNDGTLLVKVGVVSQMPLGRRSFTRSLGEGEIRHRRRTCGWPPSHPRLEGFARLTWVHARRDETRTLLHHHSMKRRSTTKEHVDYAIC